MPCQTESTDTKQGLLHILPLNSVGFFPHASLAQCALSFGKILHQNRKRLSSRDDGHPRTSSFGAARILSLSHNNDALPMNDCMGCSRSRSR